MSWMLEKVKYHYRLWRLQTECSKIEKKYSKILFEKANESQDEQNDIFGEMLRRRSFVDEDIAHLETSYFRECAKYLSIPTPPFNQNGTDWEQGDNTEKWHLSLEARAALRDKIRAEKRASWEQNTRWIALLIGSVIALTGVVSVWLSM